MQPSTEVTETQTTGTATQSGTKISCSAKKELITLRYVDSGGGASCGPHWELIDRTKPRFDPLKGLRGRRPQSGPMPKVLTITSGHVEDTPTAPAEDAGSLVDGSFASYPVSSTEIKTSPSKAAANHTSNASEMRARVRQSSPVATKVGDKKSRSASEAVATKSSISASPSSKSQRPRETKSAFCDRTSVSSSESTPSPNSKRRSQRLQDTTQPPASCKSNAPTTSPRRINEQLTYSLSSIVDHRNVPAAAADEGSSSGSEMPTKIVSLDDPYSEQSQSPKSPVIDTPPVFGRRAHRLAKAAARKAALARFNVEQPVSVSAEAYRIAQQREEPSFDKTKAVATAISNRERGLRPRVMPAIPVEDDDDDKEIEESDLDTGGLEEEEDSESEDDDMGDVEYDDDDDNSYTEHEDHFLRPNPSRKRPAQDDSGADYVPAKKTKLSVAKHKNKTAIATATVAPSRQKLVTEESSPEDVASSGSSPPLPAANVGQSKSRPGRKSNIKIPRPFSCDVCGQKFGRQEHVKRHQQSVHSGVKPHECAVCAKRFARRDNLTQHMLSHGRDQVEESSVFEEGTTYATRRGSAYGIGNRNGQTSRIDVGRDIADDTATTEQQMRIAENHRRLADQGKL